MFFLALLLLHSRALGLRHQLASEENNQESFTFRRVQATIQAIHFRFALVDEDGDGSVTFEEMKRGFGHEPVSEGEKILRSMLAACSGGDTAATSCTREQMDQALKRWSRSPAARKSVTLLQTDASTGFAEVATFEGSEQDRPCGPSVGTPDVGLEGVKCTMHHPKCFLGDTMVAWSMDSLCHDHTCICEPSPQTKRLAKVGLMGAAGVTTARNFTEPGDEVLDPGCGGGWESFKVNGHIEDIDKHSTSAEKLLVKTGMRFVAPDVVKTLNQTRPMDTEVVVYKSARHRLSKNGEYGKVCMISWQATRSPGDWTANLMITPVQFRYAKTGMKMDKGLLVGYDSVRAQLKSVFEQECCNANFRADKVIITGHSRGGSIAQINAVDMVSNWECPSGRDLGAKDIAVIMVAPKPGLFDHRGVNDVWSCNDAKNCLAGSAVTISTQGDYCADGIEAALNGKVHGHPSETFYLPCPPIPEGANYNNSVELFKEHWCHGLYNYVPLVEKHLVGERGWGSSCDGECGDPNRMVQCNQWVIMGETGCSYADPKWLKPPTQCPSSKWLPEEERCDCHFDLCTELTHHGCHS